MKKFSAAIMLFLALLILLPLPVWLFESPLYFLSYIKLLSSTYSDFSAFDMAQKIALIVYVVIYFMMCALLSSLWVNKALPDDVTKRTSLTGLLILSLFITFSSFNAYTLLNGTSLSFLALY